MKVEQTDNLKTMWEGICDLREVKEDVVEIYLNETVDAECEVARNEWRKDINDRL